MLLSDQDGTSGGRKTRRRRTRALPEKAAGDRALLHRGWPDGDVWQPHKAVQVSAEELREAKERGSASPRLLSTRDRQD